MILWFQLKIDGREPEYLQQSGFSRKEERIQELIDCLIDLLQGIMEDDYHTILEASKCQDLQGESTGDPESSAGWSLKTCEPGKLMVMFWSEGRLPSVPGRARVSVCV